ncbi:MAG: hypothetical protein C0467_30000 [Planctomycetaceae bacterium]|nr:hypothetical protein [Planctomycetaceae bacterium]
MGITPIIGQPGIQSGNTVTYRQVFRQPESVLYFPGGGTIDKASQDYGNDDPLTLRGGLLMGRVTSGKKWRPSLMGKMITAALTSVGTSITVSVATAKELVRRVGTSGTFKLTGPTAANGTARTVTITYSAVDTTTGVITITAAGVNEVQTLNWTNAPAGTFRLRIKDSSGVLQSTQRITYSATIGTLLANLQAATDAVLATNAIVWSGSVVTAVAATFSGTGYAALPQEFIIVDTDGLTAGDVDVTRTTTGVDGRFVVGSFLQPTDGSEAPVSVIPSGSGIQMVTANAADVDFPQIPYSGIFDSAQIVDWPSDTGLQAWIVSQLTAAGQGRFSFSHLMSPLGT